MQHLITCKQYDNSNQLDSFFDLVEKVNNVQFVDSLTSALKGKIMATLFYEPSTRTRFSFEAAMYKLGGNVISSESASQFSSHAKGESLEDTIQVVNQYADVVILRHPNNDSAERAAKVSKSIIINAGCGSESHPTQALLDLYTIKKKFGSVCGRKIALVGDLKHSRTIHSLIYLLSLYEGVEIILASPEEFSLPNELITHLFEKHIHFVSWYNLKDMLVEDEPDVIYLTRLQRERIKSEFIINEEKWNSFSFGDDELKLVKSDSIIMHPLPRTSELAVCVDEDKRAVYLKEQIRYGLEVRMGILYYFLKGNS